MVPLLDLDPDARMPDGRRVAEIAAPLPEVARLGPVPGCERVPMAPPQSETAGSAVPEWDDAFSWAVGADGWVPVTRGWGWHKDVEIKLALLLDAGIPACLHDRPFGELWGWPWGQVVPSAILVAPESLEDARGELAAPFPDEGGAFETAGLELAALRHEPAYRWVQAFLWAVVILYLGPFVYLGPFGIGSAAFLGMLVIVLAIGLL